MKKYQIAIIALFVISGVVSLIENKPAGYIISAIIIIALVFVWRKNNASYKQTDASLHDASCSCTTQPIRGDSESNCVETVKPNDFITENFFVAGVSFYHDDILELATENPIFDYSKRQLIDEGYEDERIYEYKFYPTNVELVEEPDNPHDANAIKVIIDGVHVGYIKSGSCSRVKNLLRSGKVVSIDADIYGGKYKVLYQDDDDKYLIETNETEIGAKVSILRKK